MRASVWLVGAAVVGALALFVVMVERTETAKHECLERGYPHIERAKGQWYCVRVNEVVRLK